MVSETNGPIDYATLRLHRPQDSDLWRAREVSLRTSRRSVPTCVYGMLGHFSIMSVECGATKSAKAKTECTKPSGHLLPWHVGQTAKGSKYRWMETPEGICGVESPKGTTVCCLPEDHGPAPDHIFGHMGADDSDKIWVW